MTLFDRAMVFIFEIEGGYHFDPNDPGGMTNFGISKRAHPDVDIANLTPELASTIYYHEYWIKAYCDALPAPIAVLMMGGAVNQGVHGCIRCLQRVLGCRDDGVIGPVTLGLIERYGDITELLHRFAAERAELYANSKNFNIYSDGWLYRLMCCHAIALSVSEKTS